MRARTPALTVCSLSLRVCRKTDDFEACNLCAARVCVWLQIPHGQKPAFLLATSRRPRSPWGWVIQCQRPNIQPLPMCVRIVAHDCFARQERSSIPERKDCVHICSHITPLSPCLVPTLSLLMCAARYEKKTRDKMTSWLSNTSVCCERSSRGGEHPEQFVYVRILSWWPTSECNFPARKSQDPAGTSL